MPGLRGALKGNALETNGCFDQPSIVAFMSESLNVPPQTASVAGSAFERILFPAPLKTSLFVRIREGKNPTWSVNPQLPLERVPGFIHLSVTTVPLLPPPSPSVGELGCPPALPLPGSGGISVHIGGQWRPTRGSLLHSPWADTGVGGRPFRQLIALTRRRLPGRTGNFDLCRRLRA